MGARIGLATILHAPYPRWKFPRVLLALSSREQCLSYPQKKYFRLDFPQPRQIAPRLQCVFSCCAIVRFSTTLLFADISGFTRLSARLNAEQLKTHTNQYFTMLIDVVARYGGDIIKFCGDAVMIVWPSESTAPRGVLQVRAVMSWTPDSKNARVLCVRAK